MLRQISVGGCLSGEVNPYFEDVYDFLVNVRFDYFDFEYFIELEKCLNVSFLFQRCQSNDIFVKTLFFFFMIA